MDNSPESREEEDSQRVEPENIDDFKVIVKLEAGKGVIISRFGLCSNQLTRPDPPAGTRSTFQYFLAAFFFHRIKK